MKHVGHLFIDRRHHLLGELQQGHFQLELVQGLHHLQADETAPHHGDVARLVLLKGRQDAVHVRDVAQGMHARAVDAGEGRANGGRTGA